MLMVDTDPVVVEARLLTGELACPSCAGVLRQWAMLVGGNTSGGRRGVASASPGELYGLREDPCAAGSGVALASCRCGVR